MNHHASAAYKQRQVHVTVSPLDAGSYIAVVVHDPTHRAADQFVEYIVDATRLDEAVSAGIEIARDLIDGRPH